MKWIIPALSVICVGTAQAQEAAVPATGDEKDASQWQAEIPNVYARKEFAAGGQESCSNIMQEVRGGRAMSLDRGAATEDDTADSLLILALDYDISGCDVLLAGLNGEIREVPEFDRDTERLYPAQ